jgi:hypothetical protein
VVVECNGEVLGKRRVEVQCTASAVFGWMIDLEKAVFTDAINYLFW